MRALKVRHHALGGGDFERLRDTLLRSPLVGSTPLNGPFQASRGFAVIFRGEGREQLLGRFPALRPHFDAVLGLPAVRALTPWWRRPSERVPNAWYLNVLLVSAGGTVGRHVDATLRKPSQVPDAVPELVSVLYLEVPRARGGELLVYDGAIASIVRPRENTLVHFRGDLAHEVAAFEGAEGLRASLVIEQYCFAPEALERLPVFKLDSRAGFGAYLDAHAQAARP